MELVVRPLCRVFHEIVNLSIGIQWLRRAYFRPDDKVE